MTLGPHEQELRQLMRQCCDGRSISPGDFDRLIEISRSVPPDARQQFTALIKLMQVEAFPPDA